MKAIFIVATLVLSAGFAQGMSFWAALAQIESGANDYAIGDVGEISRYQIRPEIWRLYSSSKRYEDPAVALRIAQKYMAKLKRDFERATGRAPTEADCVILWKSGMAGYEKRGFLAGRMSIAHQDRIRRFSNLRSEDDLLARALARTPPATPSAGDVSETLEFPGMKTFSCGSVGSATEGFSLLGQVVTESACNQNGGLFIRMDAMCAGGELLYSSKLLNGNYLPPESIYHCR
jgi:hypothetical protein